MDLKALSLPGLSAGVSGTGLPLAPSPPTAGFGMGLGMGLGVGAGPSFCPLSAFQQFLAPPPPPPMFSPAAACSPFSLGVGLPPFPWPGMPGAQYALMSGLLRQSDFLQGRLKLHEEPKPNHSYIGLISMAILSSKDKKMLLSEIYDWILKSFAYFRNKGPGWRNSIRHNLSLNDCFIKVGRAANGKGHYWAIHPANLEDFKRGDFRRRKAQRKVRRHMGLACAEDEDSSTPSPAHSPLALSPPASAAGLCSTRCRSPSCVTSYALSPNATACSGSGSGASPERHLMERERDREHVHERERDESGGDAGSLKGDRDTELMEAENCEPASKNNNWLPESVSVPVPASWPPTSSSASRSAARVGMGAGGSSTSPHPWSPLPSHSNSHSARMCPSSTSPIATGPHQHLPQQQQHAALRSQRSFDVESLLAPEQPSPSSTSTATSTYQQLVSTLQLQLGFGAGLQNPLALGLPSVSSASSAATANPATAPDAPLQSPVDPVAAAAYLHYFAQLGALCRSWQQPAAAGPEAIPLALPATD